MNIFIIVLEIQRKKVSNKYNMAEKFKNLMKFFRLFKE